MLSWVSIVFWWRILKVRLLLSGNFRCSFPHRETNRVAHELAWYALSLKSYELWMEEGPSWLLYTIQADVSNLCEV